jgi:hypothetical protein
LGKIVGLNYQVTTIANPEGIQTEVATMYQMTKSSTLELANPESTTVTSATLQELIEAISEEVQPGEDQLVAKILLHLLETEQVKPVGLMGESVRSLVLALPNDF